MRVTPEEAKDVRCPLRVDGIYCIGDKCMAWRQASEIDGYCGMAGPTTYQPKEPPRK